MFGKSPDRLNGECGGSFLHAWNLRVEKEEPHVQEVSTELYQNYVNRYAELHRKKRQLVPGMIDDRLDSEAAKVSVEIKRKLKTEAGKKRKQASLRQIAGMYLEDLLRLIPC